ncbi:MAG: ATP-binding cassette domain-containing protein [Xanthomonadales bacterium]|jgi:putative ABC transport system ATP-binding protein|nr:ATP-binding cassette domain-containing protein [Xanthomonadales bacterium]
MSSAPITVRGLNHAYGKGKLRKQILFEIDTEIPEGEIVIVTGPSGSGKTTLLTLVGALRAAQEGSVRVLGEELCGARPRTLERVRRQIGFIFQQHNLLGALSAEQNVELGLRASGRHGGEAARRKRAREMLAAVGLGDRLGHKPEALSGGQRQRVAIARALVGRPAMLLADEPTASLDRESGREVVERMKQLAQEEGTTILLVTHDNRILDIADRIVHLEDGRLSTFTESVIANSQHMMSMLAENRSKQNLHERVDELDEAGFVQLLGDITQEAQRFIDMTSLASDAAFSSMLQQGLFAFTRKLAQVLNADRASLFLVEGDMLRLAVAENLDELGDVRFPVGKGIAGAVAATGETIRIDDAYADDRFNRDIDRRTGYRTRSILCLPILDRSGRLFAVAQLLNRRDGQPFSAEDEGRFAGFIDSIGVIFESLEVLGSSRIRAHGGVP